MSKCLFFRPGLDVSWNTENLGPVTRKIFCSQERSSWSLSTMSRCLTFQIFFIFLTLFASIFTYSYGSKNYSTPLY